VDRKITAEGGDGLLDEPTILMAATSTAGSRAGSQKGDDRKSPQQDPQRNENGSAIGEQQQQHGVSDTKPGGSETRVLGHPRVFGWTRGDTRSDTLG